VCDDVEALRALHAPYQRQVSLLLLWRGCMAGTDVLLDLLFLAHQCQVPSAACLCRKSLACDLAQALQLK
jgi:hypothetical protein